MVKPNIQHCQEAYRAGNDRGSDVEPGYTYSSGCKVFVLHLMKWFERSKRCGFMRTACLCLLCLLYYHCHGQNKKIQGFQKGDFRLSLKLPYFNHLSLHPAKQFRESRFGFIGEGLGVAYSFQEKRFMEASFSLAGTSQTPLPVPNDKEYTKSMVTYFFSITDNFLKNRFSIGYGLSYSSNRWIEWIRDLSTIAGSRPVCL